MQLLILSLRNHCHLLYLFTSLNYCIWHLDKSCKWTNTYLYGVSPVWHLVWLSKCSLRAKLLPQTVQLYGLSVACLFIWRSSEGAFAKTWKQTVQVNMDPPRWHLPWRVRSFAFENALPHTYNCHIFNTDLYTHWEWITAYIKDSLRCIPDTWMASSRYDICDVQ